MKNYLLGFCLLISAVSFSQRKATVIRIVDGDTFVAVMDQSGDTLKIRASYFNTPEGKNAICYEEQPYYLESKEILKIILLNKKVWLYMANVQSYDREVARVKSTDEKYGYLDVWMIKNGYAWSYVQNNPKHYQYKLQLKAQKQKVGLWNPVFYQNGEGPINPSLWIKTHSNRK